MWRSAEVQCIDLRTRSRRDLADRLEAEALEAMATGCRRLVIELGTFDEPAILGVLERIGELMRAGGGEVTVRRSPGRAGAEVVARPPSAAEPTKWAA